MRISNLMTSTAVMGNLSTTMERMSRLQIQASNGKRILQASDDPVGTAHAMGLRSSMASVEQYTRNVTLAQGQIGVVDNALDSVTKSLADAKRIALTANNASSDQATRSNLAVQIEQDINSILDRMNSTYQNRHVFGGNQTDKNTIVVNAGGTPPYNYNGDAGVTQVQVSDSTDIAVSITAADVLNMGGAHDASRPDVLTVLVNLKKDLESGDLSRMQDHLSQLDAASQNVVSQRAMIGAKGAQLDVYSTHLADLTLNLSNQLMQVEDVDLAQTLTQLSAEQNVYQAALIAAAKINKQSLADYLS
jgi:flagellar hook-associated protein 3 FlgL